MKSYVWKEANVECDDRIEANSIEKAFAIALDRFDHGVYQTDHTVWIDVEVIDPETEDSLFDTMEVHPKEPDCRKDEHNWQSPQSVVGGMHDNPGIRLNAGGIISTEVCANCGLYRETNTWAQRPDTGEQGLESVSYKDPDSDSLQWVESIRKVFVSNDSWGYYTEGEYLDPFVEGIKEQAEIFGCEVIDWKDDDEHVSFLIKYNDGSENWEKIGEWRPVLDM